MNPILSSFLSVVTIFSLTSFTTTAPNTFNAQWKELVSKSVNFKQNKDVLHLGADEGTFSKLKLVASGDDLNLYKMRIEYIDGLVKNMTLAHHFTEKSSSKIVEIANHKKAIKTIVLWYDNKERSKKKAKLTLFGT